MRTAWLTASALVTANGRTVDPERCRNVSLRELRALADVFPDRRLGESPTIARPCQEGIDAAHYYLE